MGRPDARWIRRGVDRAPLTQRHGTRTEQKRTANALPFPRSFFRRTKYGGGLERRRYSTGPILWSYLR